MAIQKHVVDFRRETSNISAGEFVLYSPFSEGKFYYEKAHSHFSEGGGERGKRRCVCVWGGGGGGEILFDNNYHQ